MKNNKIILTDCDGVLLEWKDAFDQWAAARGFVPIRDDVYDMHLCYDISPKKAKKLIKQFNESAAICSLDTFRDSKHYVRKIYEETGYRFRVITSLSTCPYAYKARWLNLQHHFGDAIESLICLETGSSKVEILSQQPAGLTWIEDHPKNAQDGYDFQLESILIEHSHNLENTHISPSIKRVKSWKQIHRHLMKKLV